MDFVFLYLKQATHIVMKSNYELWLFSENMPCQLPLLALQKPSPIPWIWQKRGKKLNSVVNKIINPLLQNKCTCTVSASWNKHWDCIKTLHALIWFQMIVFLNRLMMFWRVTRLTVFLINTSFVTFFCTLNNNTKVS